MVSASRLVELSGESGNTVSGSLTLNTLVSDFADGLRVADADGPVATTAAGRRYQPGIGPHDEDETVALVLMHMRAAHPERYTGYRLQWNYPSDVAARCDLVVGRVAPEWGIEIKMARMLGDNGKPNDNMVTHLLSPFPAHCSAVYDCRKLRASHLDMSRAVLIYGYDYNAWPLAPLIDAFEALAALDGPLGPRAEASFDGLVHPHHRRGRVVAWEILPG